GFHKRQQEQLNQAMEQYRKKQSKDQQLIAELQKNISANKEEIAFLQNKLDDEVQRYFGLEQVLEETRKQVGMEQSRSKEIRERLSQAIAKNEDDLLKKNILREQLNEKEEIIEALIQQHLAIRDTLNRENEYLGIF